MLTLHSNNALCSPGITPITHYAHLAPPSHPMLTFTHPPSLGIPPLLCPMISCPWEHPHWQLWNELPLDMPGLTPEISWQTTSRPDSEASHNRDLRCQHRHIKCRLNSKLSMRLFSWHPPKLLIFLPISSLSCPPVALIFFAHIARTHCPGPMNKIWLSVLGIHYLEACWL